MHVKRKGKGRIVTLKVMHVVTFLLDCLFSLNDDGMQVSYIVLALICIIFG